ncbi:MAG: DUF1579 domain-containing protein [Phycisphaerales bacterium]
MTRRLGYSLAGVAALAATVAFAQSTTNQPKRAPSPPAPTAKAPAAPQAAQGPQAAPPGMSAEDMKAMMEAATPGPMHQHLAQAVGTWNGALNMWMTPDSPPMPMTCVSTVTPVMDGRFVKMETTGEMPGMGMFNGMGINGFDNVSQKFQCTWIDNMGTGMMTGTGELSPDGKTLTWTMSYNCPIQKKCVTMRQVETMTDKDSMKLEFFGPDPKSGKEFKSMEIVYTRAKNSATAVGAASEGHH